METYRFSFDAVRQQHGKVVQLQEIILRSADGALLPIIDARNPGAPVPACREPRAPNQICVSH